MEAEEKVLGEKERKIRGKESRRAQKKMQREQKKFARWFAFLRFLSRVLWIFLPYKEHRAVKDYGNRPYVFICNHYSIWDIIYPCIAVKKPLHFIAKQELWNNAFLRWFCNKCRCIPVSRDGAGTDVKAIMQAMKYLKNGENILIYPEGHRNSGDVELLPFKGGFAAIAIKTKTPLIPIVLMSKPGLFRKVHVLYGEPIEFSEYYGKKLTEEDIADCETRLRSIMLGMREDFRAKRVKKKK